MSAKDDGRETVLFTDYQRLREVNTNLLEALQAIAKADTLEAAQNIACDAIAIAITKEESDHRDEKKN